MGKSVNSGFSAIQWKGDNLKQVIEFVGMHPSVKSMKWEDYEALVKTKGLKIFAGDARIRPSVGDYLLIPTCNPRIVLAISPERYEKYYRPKDEEEGE